MGRKIKTQTAHFKPSKVTVVGSDSKGSTVPIKPTTKYIVKRAEQERMAAVIRAEGESEVAKLISEATATSGMGLIKLRRIEASKEIAATLARYPNVAYLHGGQNMLFALNLTRPWWLLE